MQPLLTTSNCVIANLAQRIGKRTYVETSLYLDEENSKMLRLLGNTVGVGRRMNAELAIASRTLLTKKGLGGVYTSVRCKSKRSCDQFKAECGECAKYKYMDLHCKLAVITGGASGIGLATAHELLCNQLYKVILADCHCEEGKKAAESLNQEHGKHKACFLQMDVRKPLDFEETLDEVTKKFGGIDILINNAGYLDDNNWKDEIDINVKAVIRGSLLGMKYLSQKKTIGTSVIVNVASTLSLDVEPPYLPIFAATQHAIGGLTKSLGDTTHFKASGVRVIGICPGPTITNLLLCQEDKALIPEWSLETNEALLKHSQKPEQVAKALVYMLMYAPPGSLWVVENGGLFKTNIPGVKQMRQRVLYV